MPPDVNTYDTSQADAAEKLAEKWHTADPMRTGSAAPQDAQVETVRQWSPALVQAFLQRLSQYAGMSSLKPGTTRRMDELYGLDAMRNPEVRLRIVQLRACIMQIVCLQAICCARRSVSVRASGARANRLACVA